MRTLHVPLAVRLTEGGEALTGYGVAVTGDRIAEIGPYEELALAHPDARERRWAGVLTPGRCEPDAAALLQSAYHPDPQEADTLGREPLTGDALAALTMDTGRWGASARRGLQRLLRQGVTSIVGPFTHPAVRTAVQRSGLAVLEAPRPAALARGARADFTVHDAEDFCLATVLAGRLVHRRA